MINTLIGLLLKIDSIISMLVRYSIIVGTSAAFTWCIMYALFELFKYLRNNSLRKIIAQFYAVMRNLMNNFIIKFQIGIMCAIIIYFLVKIAQIMVEFGVRF